MKLFLLSLFIFLLGYGLSAQTYTPLPLQSGAWVGNEYYNFGSSVYADWLTTSQGDTIIQGNRYAHFRPRLFWYGMPNEYIESNFYLRNDTATHRVYMMRHGEFYERVLFDFNLQVGDTLQGYYRFSCGDSTMVFTVTNRMMVNFGSGPRVVIDFNFAPNRFLRWIEGVGSLGGMIFPEIAMFEGGSSLGCFYEQIYVSPPVVFNSFAPCNVNVGIAETNDVELRIKSLATSSIEIEHHYSSALQMEIYALNGALLHACAVPPGVHPVSLANWSTSCYVFRFFSADGKIYFMRKMVI